MNPRPHRIARLVSILQLPRNRACMLLACLVAAAVLTMAGGCTSNSSSSGSSRSTKSSTFDSTVNQALLSEVERSHVIGPAAAGELNYRVAWQYLNAGRNVKHFSVQGDSVFVLDGQNFLTRVRVQEGTRLWRMQVAEPIDEVLGVTFTGDRIYITTGSAMLVLDPGTGSQIDKQPLLQIANTAPVMFNQYLIYGSRNGQVAWHSALVGSHWRAYKVAHSIAIAPVLQDSYLVAIGSDGSVMVLNAATTRQYWGKKLLASIVAAPAVGNGAAYVAGMDQYLWAFDLPTGRNIWKVLTESQLTDPPTLIGDRVYQQIPRQGLHCYAALPPDSPGGEMIWKSPGVNGNVILQRRAELLAWDDRAKKMAVIDAARGSLIKSVSLPAVKQLTLAGERHNELYALAEDGRLVRLVPRN